MLPPTVGIRANVTMNPVQPEPLPPGPISPPVCRPDPDPVHAREVPAGLCVPAPRPDHPCSYFHLDPDCLYGPDVGH